MDYINLWTKKHTVLGYALHTLLQQMNPLNHFKLIDNREKKEFTKIKKSNDRQQDSGPF